MNEILNIREVVKPDTLPDGTPVYDFSGKQEKTKFDWKKFKIDLSRPVAAPEPLIIQSDSDIPMLHRRNISTIAASAKVGKTFLISAIATAALHKDSFLNLHCPKSNVKVLFIDTEQDISDTQVVAKRVHRLNDWDSEKNNDNFIALNLRDLDLETRVICIENVVVDFKPDLVLLDGIVDIVGDFNNIQDSHQAVTTLTRWATKYDCHIVTCLHVNKGTAELRGHLGAFLRQKGELTLLLSKQEGSVPYIEVKPIDSRHRPIDKFCFRINFEGLPELWEAEIKPSRNNLLESIFSEILIGQTSLRHSELIKQVMEMGKVKKDAAKKRIQEAKEKGIIYLNLSGLYYLKRTEPVNENLPF